VASRLFESTQATFIDVVYSPAIVLLKLFIDVGFSSHPSISWALVFIVCQRCCCCCFYQLSLNFLENKTFRLPGIVAVSSRCEFPELLGARLWLMLMA